MNSFFLFSSLPFFLPRMAFAQTAPSTYTLMSPFGGMLQGSVDLPTYLQGVMQVTIGIAGILAVIMIVVCGIKLMGTPSASAKSEAKECIWNAIFGVLLAIGAWILLNTINPLLLTSELNLTEVKVAPVTRPTVVSAPPGNYSWSAGTSCPAIIGKIVAAVPPSYCSGTPPSTASLCCGYVDSPIRQVVGTPPVSTLPPVIPGSPPVPPLIPPPVEGLQLATIRFNVMENGGTALITISRTGPTTSTISVNYATRNGTALAGVQYTNTSGTLTFLPGVVTQTFRIPIIDNATPGGNTQFSVLLSAPSAGVVLNTSSATVTILDNELTPPPTALDTITPIVRILNPTLGFVSTIPLIPVDFSVTENLSLRSVIITAVEQISGLSAFTQTICSSTATPCPALGLTGTTVVDVNSFGLGSYSIEISACDQAGNCGKGSVVGQYSIVCAPGDLRCTSSDYLALQRCIGQPISGSCAKADLNKDGIINSDDLLLMANAIPFDINMDGIVDPKTITTNFNSTCFFHTAQDPLLPCSIRVLGNITLTATDRSTLGSIYLASKTGADKLSLSLLDTNLCTRFGCGAAGSGLGGTDQLSIYGESMLTTFRGYDFNGDGIVDGNPAGADMTFFQSCLVNPVTSGCVKADINLDGYVTYSDMNLLNNEMWAWNNTASTLSDLERTFWTGTLQPEAGILTVCQGAQLVLICATADLTKDGKIDSADLAFLQGVSIYDINGDGVVVYNISTNLPTPLPTITTIATSTKFMIGDTVATTQGVIVRKVAGDAQQFLGTIPMGATGKIVGGPVYKDGNWWWNISYDNSFTGWSVETYLVKTTALPPVPPPTTTILSTKFVMGDRVGSTANLNVRASAGLLGTFVGIIPATTTKGTIIGGPVSKDGYWWWQVKWDSGISGWSVENWLKEYTPPPAPKITAPLGPYASTSPVLIKGTMPSVEAGGTVEVFRSSTISLGKTVITATGTWSISSALADGTYIVTAIATDQSNNVGSTSLPLIFTLDTVTPTAPNVTAPTSIVRSSTVTINGTASEAGTIYIYNTSVTGTLLGTVATLAPGNTWTFTKTGYVDGTYTFAIIERDPAGNVSPVTSLSVIVDAPPPAPTILAPLNGFITNQTSVIVSGTGAAPGDMITLYSGSTILGSTAVTSTNTWSLTLTGLSDGVRTVYAVEVDPGLNQSAPSASITFTVDTIPPAAPVVTAPGATVNTSTFTMTGTAESASTVKIYNTSTSGTLLGSVVAGSLSTWAFTFLNYANAMYIFALTATDKATNVSTPTTATVQVMAPPPAPKITAPASGTYTNQKTISGTGSLAGNIINLYNNSTLLGTTTLTAAKTWSILTGLLDGVYTLYATEFDPVLSLTSAPSASVTFTLDTIPPPIPVLTSPTNGATIPSSGVTFTGTGSQSGNTITVYSSGSPLLSTSVKNTLSWSVKYASAPQGTYTITVAETDLAGNISAKTAPITITVQ